MDATFRSKEIGNRYKASAARQYPSDRNDQGAALWEKTQLSVGKDGGRVSWLL
jgi:hypothetical protein